MRLLNTQKVQVIEVYGINVPPYAILSHTWSDGEILLQDLQGSEFKDAPWSAFNDYPQVLGVNKVKGLNKLLRSTELARRNQYEYIWVDTCCIDKSSSAELSEAINSMYRWYAGADVCYAYLSDVPASKTEDPFEVHSKFRLSRWFRRGWTLQELIASQQVEIFASDWSYLGTKTGDLNFTTLLNEITGVQLDVLLGEISPQDMSVAVRMHWAAERQTTRLEDIAYCLLGIFDVNMPLLYGEGKRSFIRLQEAILIKEEDHSLFAWHSEFSVPNAVGDTKQSSAFSGLLADSPDRFWDEHDIETAMPMALTGSPSAVTSKGLGVDFLLLPCADDQVAVGADFRVILNCERLQDGQRESPVIYFKRIWGMGDQFARVRPDLKTFITPNISHQEGSYERIFVKQDPSSDMRTIRIMTAKDSSQLLLTSGISDHRMADDWKIKDAWPRQGWAERNQVFQTRELTFGMPCGILRLEINGHNRPTTVDVAIGMHAPSGRFCRSWCQVMNRNPFLDPESSFALAMREAKSGKINYSSLSTQDIHGADVPTWIVVTERNRRKGIDISVHVLSDEPRDGNEPWHYNYRENYAPLIPLSTLPKEELRDQTLLLTHHPHHHPSTRLAQIWDCRNSEVSILMGDICVVDSIETSVFPRVSFGSKVRIRVQHGGPAALGSLEQYCLNALPASDKETRRLVQVLCGDDSVVSARSYLDDSRILEGRPDSFLKLRPVDWAVIGGKLEILRVLLHSGVDVVGPSGRRLSILHLAFLLPNPDILNYIWDILYPNAKDDDTYDEIKAEHFQPTINNEDYPIHFAASYATAPGYWNSTIYQMYLGPERNRLGEKPIHRAAAMGNYSAVCYLLSHTETHLQRAQSSHLPDYKLALLRKMNKEDFVNDVDNQDRTPLWHAACSDYIGVITADLLNNGAHSEVTDLAGLAPIHVACRQGTVGCLFELKLSGANLNFPAGTLGLLPAHFAAVFGRKLCLDILLSNDAKLVAHGADGMSIHALHLAIANGHETCARAIWDSMDPKPHYNWWSLCILLEASGPVLRWMFVEVNERYWFAIEDPRNERGTQDFVCLSKEKRTPKLWVRPGVHSGTE